MSRVRRVLARAGHLAGLESAPGLRETLARTREMMERLGDRVAAVERRLAAVEERLGREDGPAGGVFHADMTIADVRAAHPDAPAVLERHHLGGCAACSVAEVETLRQGAGLHGIDLDAVLRDLSALQDR